jgi:acyl dehydratase
MNDLSPGADWSDVVIDGPYFDDLQRGQVFDNAPAVTLSVGQAAVHQSIVGDRIPLALDDHLAHSVTGASPLAHPALVWNMAIGQSTLATHNGKANLFYRGLVFRRAPHIGDTLYTTTEVVALKQQRPKPERSPTGVAVLRVTTVDQQQRPVLDFWRGAMLPLRAQSTDPANNDDIDVIGAGDAVSSEASATGVFDDWDLEHLSAHVLGEHFDAGWSGRRLLIAGGDVVSNAPELARLTLNIARVHHDETGAAPRRLVFGGHTIAVALGQATRAIPNIAYVVAWHGCEHTGPVFEGDTLHSAIAVERADPGTSGGGLLHLRSIVSATTGPDGVPRDVLDWRFVVLVA